MSTPSRPNRSGAGGRQPGDGDRKRENPAPAGGSEPAGHPSTAPWQRATATASGGSSARGSGSPGAVDAPTTQMKRPEFPSDMPDLSAAPRTSGSQQTRSGTSSARETGRREADERRPGSARTERRPAGAVQNSRKGPRRASLQVKHVDPWSVLKLSLVLSISLFLVWMVAIGVLYLVLDGMGVWDRLNTTFTDFVSVNDPNARNSPLIGPGRVFGVAAIVGVVNIVLMTAMATISSFIYNLTSDMVGGVEVTLTERD